MISLEQVHMEMNSGMLQNIADAAYEKWFQDEDEKNVGSLLRSARRAFRSRGIWPTIHEKLAVEAMLMIKFDNFLRERITVMEDEDTKQCDICRGYYLYEALAYCDSCDSSICTACSTLDEDFDMTFCSGCYSLDSL
jgi:hypothetical protein